MSIKQIPSPLPLGWLQTVVDDWRQTGGDRMLHLASQLEAILERNPEERPTKTRNVLTPVDPMKNRRKFFREWK